MTADKFTQLKISDVVIPKDIIVDVSKNRISSISKAFGTDSEMLFFIIVVVKDGKYHLVDRYDVYVAAKTVNCKKIRTFVISDSDNVKAHLTLSMKHFPNPATVIRMITPFVEQHGLKKTLDMFYLDRAYGRIYNINLNSKILAELESLIQYACSVDAHSIVPVQFFEEINRRGSEKNQSMLIKNMYQLIEQRKSKFRWPHNEFLKIMFADPEEEVEGEKSTTQKKKKKEKTANTGDREFECYNCNAEHIATSTYIGPKIESDGVILTSDETDHSQPIYSLPLKYEKYLGVSKEYPPVLISAKDMDWESLKERLSGKKFVVYVGEDAR